MGRARIASVGDWLFVGFIGLALLVGLTGGLRIGRGWYRITATDPTHLLIVAGVILAVRHLLVRHPSLRERLAAHRAARVPPLTLDRPLRVPSGREWVIAMGVMGVATVWLLKDQIWTITGVLDRGDPLFSMWRLAWIAHQLVADPVHLFDADIFYPAQNTFAYSDATLLPGLIVAPLLWAGVPVAVMHGVLYVASFFLAALSMFVLTRAVTGDLAAALLSGILFGFYPYRVSTYSHLEMQGVFLMPLAFLFLLRLLETGRIGDGVWLGASLALQTLWSFYLGAYLGVGLALVLIIRWAAGHVAIRQRLRGLLVAALVAGVTIGLYSWPYWIARHAVGERPQDEARAFSAEPRDLLNMNEMNRLYGPALMTDANAERQLFPGATTLALGVAALVPPVTPLAAAAAAGAIVAFDAALGVNGATFPWLHETAPVFRAFRVPARFGMLMGLFLTLLAGLGLARMRARWHGRPSQILATILVAVAAFELRPALPLIVTPTEAPAIYAALPDNGTGVLVDLPLPKDESEYWIDPTYLYYSTFHWRRLLNGYSGFTPPWYPQLQVASREFPSDESISVLRSRGAEFLVLHEEFYAAGRYREVVASLDQRGDVPLIATRPSPQGETRLYRLQPR